MEYDITISKKATRIIVEAARRQCRRNHPGIEPHRQELQTMVQLILNRVKADLKEDGFQIF